MVAFEDLGTSFGSSLKGGLRKLTPPNSGTRRREREREREKLVAEATTAPTLPWTFTTLGRTLEKG